ncbi:RES family NAD+ phosphorylase [Marinobacter sp.]|uniref:RES family NAD+ phosphorylase n=1 Tax=Marinobacter sp. TaxID=50741 RepID=UPI00356183CB
MTGMPPLLRPEFKTYRVIPSHFPPIDLYEDIYDSSEELELAFEIESMTNDRLLEEAGDIALVLPENRLVGPGCTPVMAAFTHIGFGSRFATEDFGAYYAANSLDAAVAETIYHRERYLRNAKEDPVELTMRCYTGTVARELHDIRGQEYAHLHNSNTAISYPETQAFAEKMRAQDSNGLLYNSVRAPGHECIAAFKPVAVSPTTQGCHLKYVFDGERISHWYKVGELHEVPRN